MKTQYGDKYAFTRKDICCLGLVVLMLNEGKSIREISEKVCISQTKVRMYKTIWEEALANEEQG